MFSCLTFALSTVKAAAFISKSAAFSCFYPAENPSTCPLFVREFKFSIQKILYFSSKCRNGIVVMLKQTCHIRRSSGIRDAERNSHAPRHPDKLVQRFHPDNRFAGYSHSQLAPYKCNTSDRKRHFHYNRCREPRTPQCLYHYKGVCPCNPERSGSISTDAR